MDENAQEITPAPGERVAPDTSQPKKERKPRLLSIDAFRGGTIVAMVFVNFTAVYSAIPDWSHHTHDIGIPFGLTYVDLIAPFFIFAIGLTYHQSYRKSLEQNGSVETFLKFLRRYFALLGIGLLGEMTITPTAITFGWAALPSIGLAGLFTFLFIRFPRRQRFVMAIVLLIAYQIALGSTIVINGVPVVIQDLNYSDVHGGFIGGFGYGIEMIFATVVGESIDQKRFSDFFWYGCIFTAAGIITSFVWGISKDHVTGPFILISVGLASLTYFGVWYLYDARQWTLGQSKFLQPMGKNSLFLYILQGLFEVIGQAILPPDATLVPVLISAVATILLIWAIGYVMDKKGVYLVI
jgi:predicted acyltransferase